MTQIEYISGRNLIQRLLLSIREGAFYPHARGRGRLNATKYYFEREMVKAFPYSHSIFIFENFITEDEAYFIETYVPSKISLPA